MAKPKNPLLSLGARGTIADSLTFQKRGRGTIAREKPIPKDPKSEAQLAQRDKYKDAVAVWHALSPEEKEAWRGVCPGLTAYQCFMSSELKYVPPPPPIDIGLEAIVRPGSTEYALTLINKDNPANATGPLTSVEIFAWPSYDLENCVVGTLYTTNGNTLKCRDSQAIGTVTGGSKQIIPVTIAAETGDYIGIYYTLGYIYSSPSGYAGVWFFTGPAINPGDERNYSMYAGDGLSLYGSGQAA